MDRFTRRILSAPPASRTQPALRAVVQPGSSAPRPLAAITVELATPGELALPDSGRHPAHISHPRKFRSCHHRRSKQLLAGTSHRLQRRYQPNVLTPRLAPAIPSSQPEAGARIPRCCLARRAQLAARLAPSAGYRVHLSARPAAGGRSGRVFLAA